MGRPKGCEINYDDPEFFQVQYQFAVVMTKIQCWRRRRLQKKHFSSGFQAFQAGKSETAHAECKILDILIIDETGPDHDFLRLPFY